MMKRSLLLIAIVVSCLAPSLGAQNALDGPDGIALQFEISKNGQVIARPVIRVAKSGTTVSAPIEGISRFSVTPTRIDASTVRLAMELNVGTEGVEVKASVLPRR